MSEKYDLSIFKAYDIRGVAGKNLSPEIMEKIGRAFGTYVVRKGGKNVAVGRDTRKTSVDYQNAFVKGLTATGCRVMDMGMIMTPTMYYASQQEGVDAGAVITASHNPAEYNGVKMTFGKASLPTVEINKVRDMMVAEDFDEGEGEVVDYSQITQQYLDEIVDKTKIDRCLKVVFDPSGATGAKYAPELMKKLGCEALMINDEIDPEFSLHEPDPVVFDNYKWLIDKVLAEQADIGVFLDGDSDRVGFVDEKGQIWLGDKIMMLLLQEIMPKYPGRKVIVELKNSEAVVEEVERLGGVPIFWKTGHTLIDEKLHEEDAIMAAEMSCHYWLADEWYKFDDSFYTVARVLRLIAASGKKFSELMEAMPHYPATPEYRVAVPAERQTDIVAEVVNYFKEKCDRYIDIDGIRGYKYDGWFLIRSSNTQPVISIRCEAKSDEGLEKIKSFVKDKLDTIEGVNLDWNRQVDAV